MNIRPLDDRLVVRLLPNKSNGGLITIPEVARDKRDELGRGMDSPLRGMVVAVGPGRRNPKGGRIPVDARLGDVVYFSGLHDWAEEDLMLIREKDIIVFEKTDA